MIYEDYPCSFHISYKLLIFLAGPPLPLPQSSYTLTLIFLPISVFPFTWSLTCPLPLPWTVSLSIVASQKIFYIYSHPNTYPGQCLRLFQGSLFRNKIYDKIFMTLSRKNFKRCKEKILNKLNFININICSALQKTIEIKIQFRDWADILYNIHTWKRTCIQIM